jgi:hypothetical protein
MAKRKSSDKTRRSVNETSRRDEDSEARGGDAEEARAPARAKGGGGVAAWARSLEWDLVGRMLALKALVLFFGWQAYQVLSNQTSATWRGRLEIWNRWDALHYLALSQHGYTATGERAIQIAFFPLYPWLTRLVAFFLSDHLVSAFVVSAVCSVAAGLLLKRLVEADYGAGVARDAVWFMLIYPTSYFLHIPYTESLTLALVIGSFYAARRNSWAAAGLLGAAASLSRINGMVLGPALAVEIFMQYRATRRWDWRWLWVLVIPAGLAGYLLLNKYVTGNAFTFLSVQQSFWSKTLTWPWRGVGGAYGSIWGRAPSEALMVGWQEVFFALVGLACTVYSWVRLRPSYAVWMTLNWLLFTSTSFMLSAPRYTLILFPVFIIFAMLSARAAWRWVITAWSLLYLSLFVGQFVQGRWAF